MKENPRPAKFVSRLSKPIAASAGPVILFTAGGARFAVAASEVEEVRDREERGSIHRLTGTEPIDFALRVGLGAGRMERFLVLEPGDGSFRVALGVTEVERMASLPKVVPLPGLFRGAERQWYRGLLVLENDVIPLVRTEHWRAVQERQ